MRLLVPFLVVALFALPLAGAHAVLESATPAPGANPQEGVVMVELRFTERVDRAHTDADVVDLATRSMRVGEPGFAPGVGHVVRVPVERLANGTYWATWRTLSLDSHTASGSFVFMVGSTGREMPPTTSVLSVGETGGLGVEGAVRGFFHVGLMIVVGVPLFVLFVERPTGTGSPYLRASASLAASGSVAGFVTFLLFAERVNMPWDAAAATSPGRSLLVRAALVLLGSIALALASWGPNHRRAVNSVVGLTLGIAAIGATLFGSSFNAMLTGRALAFLVGSTHLLAGAVWMGSVAWGLFAAPWSDTATRRVVTMRSVRWGVAALGLLALTGTAAASSHLTAASDLWMSAFGRLLLAKGALLLLAAFLFARSGRNVVPQRRTYAQAIAIAVLLLASGALAMTPAPFPPVKTAPSTEPFMADATLNTTHIVLLIAPGPVSTGSHKFQVQLHALTLGGIPNGTKVSVKFAPVGVAEPEDAIALERRSGSDWRYEGAPFSSAGDWNVFVVMERPDELKTVLFEVPVLTAE